MYFDSVAAANISHWEKLCLLKKIVGKLNFINVVKYNYIAIGRYCVFLFLPKRLSQIIHNKVASKYNKLVK